MATSTRCSNSGVVMSGGAPRTLTLAGPAAVLTSKSGCIASVAGDPAQAASVIEESKGKTDKRRIVLTSDERDVAHWPIANRRLHSCATSAYAPTTLSASAV